jgi:hypothetical protein
VNWQSVPLTVDIDPQHGARWTSLRTSQREWLWTNPDDTIRRDRRRVTPGATFVDAGGAEECFPTIRGEPDHGDAWTRAWRAEVSTLAVDVPGFGRLSRRIEGNTPVLIHYEVTAPPGTVFLHALHALLDVSPQARLVVPEADRMIVLDGNDPRRRWPSGLDSLGPDDGTAICALLPECRQATVIDREYALTFTWDSTSAPEMCSLLVWRNLGGWPPQSPYRSIGIEPMVGRAAELSGDPSDYPRVGPSGHFRWSLQLDCRRAEDA